MFLHIELFNSLISIYRQKIHPVSKCQSKRWYTIDIRKTKQTKLGLFSTTKGQIMTSKQVEYLKVLLATGDYRKSIALGRGACYASRCYEMITTSTSPVKLRESTPRRTLCIMWSIFTNFLTLHWANITSMMMVRSKGSL